MSVVDLKPKLTALTGGRGKPAPSQCWFFHRWMRWENVRQRIDPYGYMCITQTRYCYDCNFLEMRETVAKKPV